MVHQHALTGAHNGFTQANKMGIFDETIFQSSRILRPAHGQERSGIGPGILHEVGWRAIMPGRPQRMNLQRQRVNAQFIANLCQNQLGDAGQRHQKANLEFQLQDGAPFAKAQFQPVFFQRDLHRIRPSLLHNELVGGGGNLAFGFAHRAGHNRFVFLVADFFQNGHGGFTAVFLRQTPIRGEQCPHTQAAQQIGRAQAGQRAHGRFYPRGEQSRPPQRRGRISLRHSLVKNGLGRKRLSKLRTAKTNLGRQQRDIQSIICRVTMDKVKHPMPTRVQTRGNTCPGNFTLRWIRNGKA